MPYPIKAVEGERQANEIFHQEFYRHRQRPECRCKSTGFEMPAEKGGEEIRRAENVEAAREDGASNAVQGREVPSYLGFVNGEVGGDGPIQALLGEN